jgi:hypothetical protein
MKYCLEFGVRGGAHTDNVVIPNRKLAEQMARLLVMTFCNDPHANGAGERDWLFFKGCKRLIWKNETHYVAVSVLDGVMRGPASAAVWSKPVGPELLSGTVSQYTN